MDIYVLYKIFKVILEDLDYSITFNDRDEIKPNSLALYFRGGEVSHYRDLVEGVYVNKSTRLQVLVQSGRDHNNILKVLNDLQIIRSRLEQLNNKSYQLNEGFTVSNGSVQYNPTSSDAITVIFIKTDVIGEINNLGKTEQGLSLYDLNFKIWYAIKPCKS